MENKCIFCQKLNSEDILLDNSLAVLFLDSFPVSESHSLIIPKRHFSDFFESTEDERTAFNELLFKRREQLLKADKSITGFNIGINVGRSAGQSVFHLHIHLIPRRDGDTAEPKGGVRGVIPGKMKY